MNVKRSTIATSVALAIGLGMASQATAGIYAGSRLLIADLSINFSPTIPGVDPVIGQFDFGTTSTAALVPGGGDASLSLCSGNVSGLTTSCGSGGAGTPVLYTGTVGTVVGDGPADVGGGRTELLSEPLGTAPYLGPTGGANYASSDAIIDSAQLVDAITVGNGGVPAGLATSSRQISETEIDAADQGNTNTDINSTTSYTYLVTLGGAGTFNIDLLADPDLLAQFDDAIATDATASANTQFTVEITGPSGFSVSWAPEFATAGGCTDAAVNTNLTLAGGALCTAEVVAENLNGSVTAPGPLPTSTDDYSREAGTEGGVPLTGAADIGFGAYSLSIAGLTAGDYAITLNGKTAASVTRVAAAVPEPATLAMMGAGLLMFGAGGRRQKKAKA